MTIECGNMHDLKRILGGAEGFGRKNADIRGRRAIAIWVNLS
jgi:hypothetical protein